VALGVSGDLGDRRQASSEGSGGGQEHGNEATVVAQFLVTVLRAGGDRNRDHERRQKYPSFDEEQVQLSGDRGEDYIVHRGPVPVSEANDRGQVRPHRT
jgi:hypothetical protein